MTTLLAIDPGEKTGYALFRYDFDQWSLINAGVEHPERRCFVAPHYVIIENPQIYPHAKSRPNDILKLARLVGRFEERYHSSVVYRCTPHDWKGSVDGDIMVRRIESALTPEEMLIVDRLGLPKSYRHNAVDAIGLGKWFLRQPQMRGKR